MERHFAEYLSDLNNATGIAVQTVLGMQDSDVLYLGGNYRTYIAKQYPLHPVMLYVHIKIYH